MAVAAGNLAIGVYPEQERRACAPAVCRSQKSPSACPEQSQRDRITEPRRPLSRSAGACLLPLLYGGHTLARHVLPFCRAGVPTPAAHRPLNPSRRLPACGPTHQSLAHLTSPRGPVPCRARMSPHARRPFVVL